jgi:hypothetical protein
MGNFKAQAKFKSPVSALVQTFWNLPEFAHTFQANTILDPSFISRARKTSSP